MKRTVALLVTAFALIFLCPSAAADEELDSITDEINSRLDSIMDDDTKDFFDEQGISADDTDTLTDLDQRSIFKKLYDMFINALKTPIAVLGKILAISVIYAALKSMRTDAGSLDSVFGTVCVLSVITVISGTVSVCFEQLKSSIESINRFMISYIPILSSVTAAGGYAVTAGSYSASTVLICETAAFVSSKILIPFMSAVTAVTVVSAVDHNLKFAGAADSVKRLVTWLLATVTLIFVGLMSLKGITAASADSLTAKTLRFAASSFIPVIGGSVSDAFLAVKGSMGVIRSTTGAIGIIAVCIIAARPFIMLLAMKLVLWAGRISNDLMGLRETAELLRNMNSILSIGLSILITFTAAFIVSTASVLRIALGGA